MLINIRNLFIVAFCIKLAALAIVFNFNGVASQWVFGIIIPILAIVGYSIVGYRYKGSSISDEKFADSCYYLGFIFTIATIIVVLTDLDSIDDELGAIAVRFGVAMISTLVGVIARLLIISFKQDTNDAINAAEDQIIESANRLNDQLQSTILQFEKLDTQLNNQSQNLVAKMENEIAKMSQDYTARLSDFFDQYTSQAQENLDTIKNASQDFAKSLNNNARKMEQLSGRFEQFSGNLEELMQTMAATNISQLLTENSKENRALTQFLQQNSLDYSALRESFNGAVGEFTIQSKNAQISYRELANNLTLVSQQINQSLKSVPELDQKAQQLQKLIDAQHKITSQLELTKQLSALLESTKNNNELMKVLRISQEQLTESVHKSLQKEPSFLDRFKGNNK